MYGGVWAIIVYHQAEIDSKSDRLATQIFNYAIISLW